MEHQSGLLPSLTLNPSGEERSTMRRHFPVTLWESPQIYLFGLEGIGLSRKAQALYPLCTPLLSNLLLLMHVQLLISCCCLISRYDGAGSQTPLKSHLVSLEPCNLPGLCLGDSINYPATLSNPEGKG